MKSIAAHGVALVALLTASTALAAISDWATSEGGRMRLSALSDDGNGRLTALLEIQPAPGWKTYWRNPGDAGVPPQIDLSGAENLKLVKVDYPTPEIGMDEAGRFIGYHAPVGIVLELEKPKPAEPSKLSADVLVGLCSNICLPFQSHFDLSLTDSSRPQADEFMNIQMAKAALPELPSADFEIIKSGLTAGGASFEATLTIPGKEMPDVAIAPSEGLLLGRPTVIVDAGKATVRYPVNRLPKELAGATVTLLVKSAGRAMEATLALK